MTDLHHLLNRILAFRDARDWRQFHTVKDMALSLILEASELAEHFQWKSEHEIQDYLRENREKVGDELADVLYWVLLISHDLGIDLPAAFLQKMEKNEEKYPVELAKGRRNKYRDL